METSRLARWAPLSGIAYVALSIVAFVLLVGDEPGDSDAEILSWYADDGNRGKAATGAWLMLFAALFFIWFLAVIRGRLARAEGRPGPYASIAFGSGLVAAALWLVADVFFMAVAYTVGEDDKFTLDPNLQRLVSEMGYLFFVIATPAAAVVVLATSLLARKARVVPRWLAWIGFPVAALMFFAFLAVVPWLLFLGWVLVVSVIFLVRPEQSEPADRLSR